MNLQGFTKGLTLFLAISLLACGREGSRNNDNSFPDLSLAKVIPIDLEKRRQLMLSEVADSVWYLALESTEEAAFGAVDKLMFAEERIVIVDRNVSEGVFIFDYNGKFRGKISNKGRGPEEYLGIEDVTIDSDNNLILLYDASNQTVHLFDFDGNYVKNHSVGLVFDFFEYIGDGKVICYNSYVLNPELQKESNASVFTLNYQKHKDSRAQLTFPEEIGLLHKTPLLSNNISISEDISYVYDYYTNSIYSCNYEGKFYLRYSIDFGKYNIPESAWSNEDFASVRRAVASGSYAGGLLSFQVANDWIIGSVEYGRSPSTFLYNIRNDSLYFTPSMITNDLTPDFPKIASFPIALTPPYHSDGRHIVSAYEPMILLNIIESVKREAEEYGFTFEVPVEMKNLTPNSNPVLQIVRLRTVKDD